MNDATKILVDKISKVLDEMAPIKTIQTRTNYVPWLSEDTKDLQHERDDAQKKASHTDDPEDWRLFRSLRNLVTSRSRSDKAEWEQKKLDDKENTPTDIWNCVKSWLGWGGGGTPTQLYSEGKMISSPAGLASTMNKLFLDKIKRLRNVIPAAVTDPLAKMKEAMANRRCSFQLSRVKEEDVLKVILVLKNSSATVPVPSQVCGSLPR